MSRAIGGHTNLIEHHIETHSQGGCAQAHLPFAWIQKKPVVLEELQAMLDKSGIEEFHSEWSSPIILVPKANGSV